jgi:hypothetical protein
LVALIDDGARTISIQANLQEKSKLPTKQFSASMIEVPRITKGGVWPTRSRFSNKRKVWERFLLCDQIRIKRKILKPEAKCKMQDSTSRKTRTRPRLARGQLLRD